MICKKCGAYNPDHATFCKVCAANLREQPEVDAEAEATDVEETVEENFRPKRGNVQAPDFSARRAGAFKAAERKPVPVKEEEDEDDVTEEEEQEVKESKKSPFARPSAPVKKRRIVDEEDEGEDEDEDEDDYDEEEGDEEAEKLESEPKTTRFSRMSAPKKRRVIEEEDEDEEDDEDEDEDEDDFDEDEDDEYEEYEPTPPRRKKPNRSQSKSKDGGGFNIVTVLIACLLVILLLIVGIVAFCNIKGGTTQQRLPSFLQFNCGGKKAADKTTPTQLPAAEETADTQVNEPTAPDAPVTGTEVDYSVTTLEELVDDKGNPSISIHMTSRAGDTVTIVLPNQDDYVFHNTESTDQPYQLTIPKFCFFPNTPLTESVYTVTPQILVTHADGTQESLAVDSFDLTFPTIQLELTEPAASTIPAEGLMTGEGNELMLKGKVDDHTVTVTVNGQPVVNMYEGGNFEYLYTMQSAEPETVLIEATKPNCVSSSYSFTVTPYVFIPEKMTLTVVSEIDKLRADKNNKVTVTGTTVPGTTLTATPAAEYQTSVACGSPTVDADGNYSFDVTFDKSYYGIASITIHAKKDGYEEGETTCYVSRMYAKREDAIAGYNKTKSYHEVPSKYAFDKVMENPTDSGFYRFVGKIESVDPENGIVTFAAKTSNKDTINIYVLNASAKWEPDKHVGKAYKLYSTLNGLYDDGTSLYVTAWFVMND